MLFLTLFQLVPYSHLTALSDGAPASPPPFPQLSLPKHSGAQKAAVTQDAKEQLQCPHFTERAKIRPRRD